MDANSKRLLNLLGAVVEDAALKDDSSGTFNDTEALIRDIADIIVAAMKSATPMWEELAEEAVTIFADEVGEQISNLVNEDDFEE